MAFKGTAGKSASGASMSKYDVEVEARLKKLEEKGGEINTIEAMVSALEISVDESKSNSHDAPATGGDEELARKVDYLFKHLGLSW